MSPEQARGEPLDARSDLFSLGTVLYEMLSGRHPFRRNSSAETASAILRDAPADLGRLEGQAPGAVKRLVGRCLEKRPEDRFQTANDLALALDVLGRGEEWAGTASSVNRVVEESGPATSAAPVRSRRLLWPVAGLAGLLAMAAAAWLPAASPTSASAGRTAHEHAGLRAGPVALARRRAGRVLLGWREAGQPRHLHHADRIPGGAPPHHGSRAGPGSELVARRAPDRLHAGTPRRDGDASSRLSLGRVGPQAGRLRHGWCAVLVSRQSLAGCGARASSASRRRLGSLPGLAPLRRALPDTRGGRRAAQIGARSGGRSSVRPQVLAERTPTRLCVVHRFRVPCRRRRVGSRFPAEGAAPTLDPTARHRSGGGLRGAPTGRRSSSSISRPSGSGASRSEGTGPPHRSSWPDRRLSGRVPPPPGTVSSTCVRCRTSTSTASRRSARQSRCLRLRPRTLAPVSHPTDGGSPSSPSARWTATRSGSPTPTAPTRSSSRAGLGCRRARRVGRRMAYGSPSTP